MENGEAVLTALGEQGKHAESPLRKEMQLELKMEETWEERLRTPEWSDCGLSHLGKNNEGCLFGLQSLLPFGDSFLVVGSWRWAGLKGVMKVSCSHSHRRSPSVTQVGVLS